MKEYPWENNAFYFYLSNEKTLSLVPVKEIDFHVQRGVSFPIKDAEM